jgi:beta-xylosidase
VTHRGSIDPRTFVDAKGNLWMDWKSDDNANPQIPWTTGNGFTGLYAQRLSANGRTLLGSPNLILQPSLPWEGTIIEAPDMVLEQGRYWLFYSGGWFNSPGYAIGAARCEGPAGPCATTASRPLIASNSQGAGPGEPSVFEDASGFWIVYSPWASNDPAPTPNRPVVMARLGFNASGPYIGAW